MPVQIMQGLAFFFSRLTLFRKLGLRAFPVCDIGWVDTDAKKLQFDYSTPPIYCEMVAVAAKQMLAGESRNPLLGRLESC